MEKSKSSQVLIFLTIFLYLLGFGIIIPILPLLGKELGGKPNQIAYLMSIYSLMQFVFAPIWGRLSDRKGRRKILIICLLGEGLTYIWFALARDFNSLFFARMFAGIFAGSISTASAYISDITPPKERSKGMALIGTAFGLGFVFGPAMGGGLMVFFEKIFYQQSLNDPLFSTSMTSLFVSVLCLGAFIFSYKKLPESLSIERRKQATDKDKEEPQNSSYLTHQIHRLKMIFQKLKLPRLGPLFTTFFLVNMSMALMESTLVLFVNQKFGWSKIIVSYGFAYVGIVIVITQGFLVRRILPKIGEKNMIPLGLIFMTLGYLGIVLAQDYYFMALAMTFLSVGNGLTNPSLLGAISLISSESDQGINLGVSQSMSSVGRILGPALGGNLFQYFIPESPYIFSCIFILFGIVLIFLNRSQIPSQAKG